MKLSPINGLLAKCVVAGAALSLTIAAQAHPYASGVTNNNGSIQFILNEGGGNVYVVFEDGTTNTLGVLGKGEQAFPLAGHTSYAIYVVKTGNGTPTQISTDTDQFAVWNSPRGLSVNQNPSDGSLFGRVYVGNGAAGGTAPYNKGHGLYALSADLSDSSLGLGANASAIATFANSGSSGPYKMRVAPDNTLLVGDFSTAAAALWQFAPDFSSSNLVLGTIGQVAAAAAGIHGDMYGTPYMSGSLDESNLVLWTFDSGMAVPAGTTLGPGTSVGSYNCAFRYDIGAGPLPWTNQPNYAYTMGLDGIAELRTEGDIGKDGKIICGFGRANLSNPDIQILDPTGASVLWDSWHDTAGASDPWNGVNGFGGAVGTYCGVRVSPDGRFLASVDIDNGITLATMTNGIPDDNSIFGIQNTPSVGNSRGMDWDAADNLYVCSSGQGLLRVYSLGISTTCITSNDYTGTNGSFQLILPNATATVAASQPNASQNYINNVPAGTPIAGVFTITLDQTQLSAPVTVNFTRSGSAVYQTNYTMNLGTDANGVVISSNSVTFPAGTHPGGGNWSVNVQIIPTATPVSGPTLTVGLRILGGPSYLAGSPGTGTINIANTGPQLLVISTASTGATMNRGVQHDYAEFIVTRYGDINGPGNSAGNVNPTSYTVTNYTYSGTAVFPVDYTARAQRSDPAGDGVIQTPTDGSPGIVIYPGNVTITNLVGNPVAHANINLAPVNDTITIALTNSVTTTNGTSSEGFAYSVSNNAVTVTELDNAVGPEVVLWSNPLISASDSTNWTLTFATTTLGTNTVSPVVVPNYTNDETAIVNSSGGTNDFRVEFGYPIANDSVSPSPVMAANGWNNALRMTVNKDGGSSVSGVNLYPQDKKFQGNYALRFSMYLSMWSFALNNPFAGTTPREFAAFGINHYGTNCNWRLATPITAGTPASGTTNADGVWFAIDAGINSITPADFDAFTSPALPNSGVGADLVSNNTQSQSGVFKHPPFAAMSPAGGQPIDQWVDVSVEVTAQTNVSMYMNHSLVLPSFAITNGGFYTNGTFMLGYLDPVPDVSDNSAFVYYSNVRVVELSPYIVAQPVSLIVTQGANVSFTSTANFATAPITNVWFTGNTGPLLALQTDRADATNLTSTLSLTDVQTGTNYLSEFSDMAGSVTGLVASLEVVSVPTNVIANAGATVQFQVTASGSSSPTSYQWQTNGVNLVNGSHYAGVTTSALTINGVQASDAGIYSVVVVNPAGTVTPSATLTVIAPPTFSHVSLSGTDVVLSFSSPNPGDTTSSYMLLSSPVVEGPYTNTPAALFTGAAGTFQVTVPQTGSDTMFYRLQHL